MDNLKQTYLAMRLVEEFMARAFFIENNQEKFTRIFGVFQQIRDSLYGPFRIPFRFVKNED